VVKSVNVEEHACVKCWPEFHSEIHGGVFQ